MNALKFTKKTKRPNIKYTAYLPTVELRQYMETVVIHPLGKTVH